MIHAPSLLTIFFSAAVFASTSVSATPYHERRDFGCSGATELGSTAVLFDNCTPGQTYTCQIVKSDCSLASGSLVESLVVKEAATSQALGGSANVATAQFTCPSSSMYECSVIFSSGQTPSDTGIRVVSGTGSSSSSSDSSSSTQSSQ